jgi:alkaline ceramidase
MAAIVLAIVATGLAVLHPAANAFALMTLGLPAFFLLIHELKR